MALPSIAQPQRNAPGLATTPGAFFMHGQGDADGGQDATSACKRRGRDLAQRGKRAWEHDS